MAWIWSIKVNVFPLIIMQAIMDEKMGFLTLLFVKLMAQKFEL